MTHDSDATFLQLLHLAPTTQYKHAIAIEQFHCSGIRVSNRDDAEQDGLGIPTARLREIKEWWMQWEEDGPIKIMRSRTFNP